MQEDCARVLMFRSAHKELKNSTGHNASQIAIGASYHSLSDIIQNFKPEDVGENQALSSHTLAMFSSLNMSWIF